MVGSFPFLIGTVRTGGHGQNGRKNRVSIPHRYGKNAFEESEKEGKEQFPFLIGTVRTFFFFCYYHHHKKFPFLIGTVRTQSVI